jgi:hypothetical protein
MREKVEKIVKSEGLPMTERRISENLIKENVRRE